MPGRDGSDGSSSPEKRAARRPRDPSYPDRGRLDNDVRALMRQPSTPWITFDRDSRVAAGEMSVPQAVLSNFRRSIHDGMFEKAAAEHVPEPTPSSRLEPSSLIVAQDVEVSHESIVDPFAPHPRHGVKWIAAGFMGVVMI